MSIASTRYAVAIFDGNKIVSLPVRHRSLGEARAYARAYNYCGPRRAVLLRHPLYELNKIPAAPRRTNRYGTHQKRKEVAHVG